VRPTGSEKEPNKSASIGDRPPPRRWRLLPV
jgi:hypothetical protein